MFIGKYTNSIDDKARMIIPAKFRYELGESCVVAKGLDKCLVIYTNEEWERFVSEKLSKLPDSDPKARAMKRYYFSSANSSDVDKQGRIKIPQDLLDYAEITKDLVTIGSDNKIEIWSKTEWDAQLDEESGEIFNASDLAAELAKYGF